MQNKPKLFIYRIEKTFRRSDLRKIFYMFKWKLTGQRHPDQFSESHPCVFVLSTGRVGSETMAHILKKSGNALVYHEPLPELFGLSKKAYELFPGYLGDEKMKSLLMEGFLTARRALFDHALYCDRGYIEAGPPATFLAPVIHETIPQVKFIHLIREPMSVVRSALRRKWYSGHPYDPTRIIPLADSQFRESWDDFSPVEKNCWLWAETNRWIHQFLQGLPEDRSITLHSEDVFSADPQAIHLLFELINQPNPSKQALDRILRMRFNAQETGTGVDHLDENALREPLLSFFYQMAADFGYAL